jgi:hypothetical protein
MKRCHCCQERFGLIRHYYDRLQFCSAICVASHRAAMRQAVVEKISAAERHIRQASPGETTSRAE